MYLSRLLKKDYSPYQFAFWRIAFGIYVFFYTVTLIPFGTELYSNAGTLSAPSLNWTFGYFPNIFDYLDAPIHITIGLGIASLSALCFAAGFYRRINALILWYLTTAFLNRNILTLDPSMGFTGWLLAASVIIPDGEPLSLSLTRTVKKIWHMPGLIYWGGWLVAGVAYTTSGLDKFMSPSWRDGSAFELMLNLPITHDSAVVEIMRTAPTHFLMFETWAAAIIFSLVLPAIFFAKTRLLIWVLLNAAFLCAFIVFDLTQVIIGIFLFHFFLLDSNWFIHAKNLKYSLVKAHSEKQGG